MARTGRRGDVPAIEGEELERCARIAGLRLAIVLVATNLIGAALVFTFGVWILPRIPIDPTLDVDHLDAMLVAAYLVVGLAVGGFVGFRIVLGSLRWVVEDRAPTACESRRLQRVPLHLTILELTLWGAALVLFTTINGLIDQRLISRALFTTLLGGISTCAVTFLLAELIMRDLVVEALARQGARPAPSPGVTARGVTAWAVGSGVALLGVVIAGIDALIEGEQDAGKLALAMTLIAGLGLGVGLLTTLLASRSIAAPVRSVERAMAHVERGDLDVSVPVYDGSELGQLQSGFNTMAAGLRERERLRDLFERHVGGDVAREALQRGVAFAADRRDAAVLFVDLVGSTGLATMLPPEDVLALLNRFFALVVEEVDRHGGWVNKFEGDGALAVFGVPQPVDDPAGAALAAARAIATRLPEAVPGCDAGIGVAFGPVVAGNLGEQRRFEFTVIGDAVNTAARLTELAKVEPGRVLTTAATVRAAGERAERRHWEDAGELNLRGRLEPVASARRADTTAIDGRGSDAPERDLDARDVPSAR